MRNKVKWFCPLIKDTCKDKECAFFYDHPIAVFCIIAKIPEIISDEIRKK